MLTIRYDANLGDPCSDMWAGKQAKWIAEHIDDYIDHNGIVFTYSTANIFNQLRLLIAQGKLDCKKIEFSFNREPIIVNEYGAITDWPEGFCDLDSRTAEEILRLSMEKMKKKPRRTKPSA